MDKLLLALVIHIGTSGFQYPEWKGSFYPADLSTARMLGYYAARFSTTESNYTFRQIPKPTTFERWAERTPEQFRFSLKAPQRITHFAKLQGCGDTLRYFCEVAGALGPKLGAILFQLPPSLKKDVALLEEFLAELPSGTRAAFEFRHKSWLDDAVYQVLRERGAALCIARSDDFETPIVATASFGYLRLRQIHYSETDLDFWAATITAQAQWEDTYVYFKHEESGTGPRFGAQLLERLGIKATVASDE
ncbi:MAG TPA: DUF72 domain-containing protein [Chthoniobacteraceae bacterium]|jgi:uncharacterized protein YecE (DUF72 family)